MNIAMILWGIPQAMRATALIYPEFKERLKDRKGCEHVIPQIGYQSAY
jgi:hypothetical protein